MGDPRLQQQRRSLGGRALFLIVGVDEAGDLVEGVIVAVEIFDEVAALGEEGCDFVRADSAGEVGGFDGGGGGVWMGDAGGEGEEDGEDEEVAHFKIRSECVAGFLTGIS